MGYNIDDRALARLHDLVTIVSPTMFETPMTDFLSEKYADMGASMASDHMGNMLASFNNGAERTIALSAHADTIAVQITNILPNGYLQFRPIGPLPHTLLGQRVSILNWKGEVVDGVIGFDPTSQYGQPKGLVFDDLWIDICVPNKSAAIEHVRIGDLAVFTPCFQKRANNCISATALDNRVGLFIISEVANILAQQDANINLEIILTAQEEVGLRGSQIVKTLSKADSCIVVDVEYATDTLTPHCNQLSEVMLGCGPVLLHKADNNRELRNSLAEFASRSNIQIQHGVGRYPYGGTDATQMQVGLGGMPVVNIGIPCRYMHSPIETCSISDISNAINLITHFLTR